MQSAAGQQLKQEEKEQQQQLWETDTNYNLCFEIIYGCGLNWNGTELCIQVPFE